MSSNNPDDSDEERAQRADSVANDAYDSPVNDPDGGNFSQFDAAAEDNITTDPSKVESTWTPTEGPDPSEMNTRVDFPDDPEINVDSVSTTTTDSEVDRDDVEGNITTADAAESPAGDTNGNNSGGNIDADRAPNTDDLSDSTDHADHRNDTNATSHEVMDTTDTTATMDATATSENTTAGTKDGIPVDTAPNQEHTTTSTADEQDNTDVPPDVSGDATEIGSEPSIDPAVSTEQTGGNIQQDDSETQHTDPIDDVPLKHGDSFEKEPQSFVVEKTLLILTVVVIAISGWSLSLQFIAQLPIPGVTIAVGLIALWTVFLLTIGRYVANFGLWFAAL